MEEIGFSVEPYVIGSLRRASYAVSNEQPGDNDQTTPAHPDRLAFLLSVRANLLYITRGREYCIIGGAGKPGLGISSGHSEHHTVVQELRHRVFYSPAAETKACPNAKPILSAENKTKCYLYCLY